MHLFPATVAAAVIGGALLVALSSCEQILGLEQDVGETATMPDGGALDATTRGDDGGDRGGDDGDGSATDASSRDATVDGPSVVLPSGAWHLDLAFSDGGMGYENGYKMPEVKLGVATTGLALREHPTLGVIVVGLESEMSHSVLLYTVSNLSTYVAYDSAELKFGGAFVDEGGVVSVLTVTTGSSVKLHTFTLHADGTSIVDSGQTTLSSEQVFATIIGVVDGGVLAVGSTGDAAAAMPAAAEIVVTQSSDIASVVGWADQSATLLEDEMTVDSNTYYVGVDDPLPYGQNVSAIWSTKVKGVDHSGALAMGEEAGLTDLVAFNNDVYGVGFAGTNFILAPLPSSTLVAPQLFEIDSGGSMTFYSAGLLNAEHVLMGQADLDGGRILVGGNFGGVDLSSFQLTGAVDEQAFAEPYLDGGAVVYRSGLQLEKYLPASDNVSWAFQTMLLSRDGFLYVTATNLDGSGQWVVLRLTRSPVGQ